MTREPPDPEIQRAAAAIQLSIAIMETLGNPEIGNDIFLLFCNWWMMEGRSEDWMDMALEAIDDIRHIAFSKNDAQKWVLVVEWSNE